jgi:hypothetical protein
MGEFSGFMQGFRAVCGGSLTNSLLLQSLVHPQTPFHTVQTILTLTNRQNRKQKFICTQAGVFSDGSAIFLFEMKKKLDYLLFSDIFFIYRRV